MRRKACEKYHTVRKKFKQFCDLLRSFASWHFRASCKLCEQFIHLLRWCRGD